MMKNKIGIIILLIFIALLAIGSSLIYIKQYKPYKTIVSNCAKKHSFWNDYVFGALADCHNHIVIYSGGFDSDQYTISDSLHGGTLAWIDNLNDYVVKDNILFVINKNPGGCKTSNGSGTKEVFCVSYYKDGQLITSYYDNLNDIPTHLVINTLNGNVLAYNSLEQMPENDRLIFQQLENK